MKPITMIIPAKGRSTRLPRKNVKLFCGYPLVAWSIVQGIQAELVGDIWVTTDDDEIAEVAEEYGARVMFRGYKDDDDTPGYVPVQECLQRLLTERIIEMDDPVITRLCTTPHMLPHDNDEAICTYEWLHMKYGATAIGIGAELRTLAIARRVVDNIWRHVGWDSRCENDYGIVQTLAFWGLERVSTMLSPAAASDPMVLIKYLEQHPAGYYYKVHPWQMQDLDTLDEWEFAELVAEHYILKGRDMLDVYTKI